MRELWLSGALDDENGEEAPLKQRIDPELAAAIAQWKGLAPDSIVARNMFLYGQPAPPEDAVSEPSDAGLIWDDVSETGTEAEYWAKLEALPRRV